MKKQCSHATAGRYLLLCAFIALSRMAGVPAVSFAQDRTIPGATKVFVRGSGAQPESHQTNSISRRKARSLVTGALASGGIHPSGIEYSHGPATESNPPQGPKIWLQDARRLATGFHGTPNGTTSGSPNLDAANLARNNAAAQALGAGQGQPLTMVKGDFDGDGVEDLVAGYATPRGPVLALYRGNLDAFAPQSEASFQAIARAAFPPPFLPTANVFAVPVNPDFIATGDITGHGFPDILIASRAGGTMYLFPGDGRGNFGEPQALPITGRVTALAAGEFGNVEPGIKVFVGIADPVNGFELTVYSVSGGILSALASYPLDGPASDIEFGDLGDFAPNVVFLLGGEVNVLRPPTMEMEAVSLPISARAMALGRFIFDRNPGLQLALLAADGSVQFAVHDEIDPIH